MATPLSSLGNLGHLVTSLEWQPPASPLVILATSLVWQAPYPYVTLATWILVSHGNLHSVILKLFSCFRGTKTCPNVHFVWDWGLTYHVCACQYTGVCIYILKIFYSIPWIWVQSLLGRFLANLKTGFYQRSFCRPAENSKNILECSKIFLFLHVLI